MRFRAYQVTFFPLSKEPSESPKEGTSMTKEEIINEAVETGKMFPRHDPENGAVHAVSCLQAALHRINAQEG